MSHQYKEGQSFEYNTKFCLFIRLFVFTLKNVDDSTSFSKYYTENFEIKENNMLIDSKRFFDMPIKKQRRSQK